MNKQFCGYVLKVFNIYDSADIHAYYKEDGDGCLPFCSSVKYATIKDSADDFREMMEHKDYYLKQFNARDMYPVQIRL